MTETIQTKMKMSFEFYAEQMMTTNVPAFKQQCKHLDNIREELDRA